MYYQQDGIKHLSARIEVTVSGRQQSQQPPNAASRNPELNETRPYYQ